MKKHTILPNIKFNQQPITNESLVTKRKMAEHLIIQGNHKEEMQRGRAIHDDTPSPIF